MNDPVEAILNSPKTLKAMSNLRYERDDLKSLTKE